MNGLTQTSTTIVLAPQSVMKSLSAFNLSPTLVCYIDKDGNSYRKQDFLDLAGGNDHLARLLFDTVINHAPSETIEYWKSKGEFPL